MQRNQNSKSHLAALAFGERSMQIDEAPYDMGERLKTIAPGLLGYESLIEDKLFCHHSSLLTINGMKIVATASTPVRSQVTKTNKTTLIIPFSGQGNLIADGRALQWQAGINAVLLPNCGGSSESTNRSVLMIDLDPNKLEMIARSMLGISPDSAALLNIQIPREVNLQVGRVSFDSVFRQLTNLLDQYSVQPELLNQSGIDELFYRNIVIILQPSLFLDASTSTPNRKYARRLLDRVCQYVEAHLNEPISLTDLERISSMSKRKLHYAFLKRYNCTPMQWIRTERLTLLHNKLNQAPPGDKVTTIALDCGFNKSTTYVDYYTKQFGELPSATLARSLAR